MNRFKIIGILLFVTAACNKKPACPKTGIILSLIDSIKRNSDSSYKKRYRPNEFARVEYYISKKDSGLSQVMKDSAGTIRQLIITKKNIRTYYAEFYANGQLKGSLPLDSLGKFNGPAVYYYENGCMQSEGKFLHGLYTDHWKNYDKGGKLMSIDEYDNNGQLIKTELSN